MAQEHLALLVAVGQRAELLGQAPLGHHVAGDFSGPQNVVGRPGGHHVGPEDQLLGDTAAHHAGDRALQPLLAVTVAVRLRQEHGHAQRAAARDDGDLVHGIMRRHLETDDGMARLVIGGELLLFVVHHHRAALGAHHDFIFRLLEVDHIDQPLVGARGEQGGLVHEIGKIGTGEAGRTAGDDTRDDVVRHRDLAHVHLENLLAATHVGQRHHDLSVETAGTQQGGVEHVGTVGGGDDDDALATLEAVHLHQQLIEGLFALVVTAAEAGAAMTADGVDFIDEDDAGRVLLRLFEHIAHARRAHAHEHLDEIGTRDREERHLGLAGNGFRQQRLTGTRRTHHQYATGDLAAEFLELAGVAQELDQLGHFLLGFFHAGHVGESNLALVLAHHAGPRATKGHGATTTAAALPLPHEENPHGYQQQHGEPGNEHLHQQTLLLLRPGLDHYVLVEEFVDHAGIAGAIGKEFLPPRAFALDGTTLNHYFRYLSLPDLFDEIGVRELFSRNLRGTEAVEDRHQHDRNHYPQN